MYECTEGSYERCECIDSPWRHTNWVFALTVHGDFLYLGSGHGEILELDLSSNACVSVLKRHTDGVFALTVHGGFLYSGSADTTIRKWNL